MVADILHTTSSTPLHPSVKVFGHDLVVDLPLPTLFLAGVGTLFLLRYAFSLLQLFLELTVIPGKNVKRYLSRSGGTYALVTGCTSGIGLAFAHQLAAKGFNVVLLGRRGDALEELGKEIETKYNVKTAKIVVDLSRPESRATGFAEVERLASTADIGVLINNAGASHEMPVLFAETDPDEIDNIVQTNILATLHLTRVILPSMIKRKAPSLVLNIGSLDGRIPAPLLAAYSCTKGGLQPWSIALAEEVKKDNIDVQMVLPAFVVSNMSGIKRPSLTVPTAKAFVKSTLSSIGLARGAQGRMHEMTPFWTHAIADYLVGFGGGWTEWVGVKVVEYLHVDIRRRVLRKRARVAGKGKVE